MDALKLSPEQRAALITQRKAESDAFLAATIPVQFRAFSADLYPCPEKLALAVTKTIPRLYDDNGNDVPDYRGGLLFHGPTGSGKSRAAFAVAKRWCEDDHDLRLT